VQRQSRTYNHPETGNASIKLEHGKQEMLALSWNMGQTTCIDPSSQCKPSPNEKQHLIILEEIKKRETFTILDEARKGTFSDIKTNQLIQ
jgi:hypothetical protein